MCGICGTAGFADEELVKRMTGLMRARGPDDETFFRAEGLVLGCRRLSVIDLAGGRQPLANEDGTVSVMQNGEIYNHLELREELEKRGHRFRTASDTEVIAHCYEEYGAEAWRRLNGDFAVALWDGKRRELVLARDRAGVRPLYYVQSGRELVFASELKCLLQWPKTPRELDPAAVDAFLSLRYVPGGRTLFRHVKKLAPGAVLTYRDGRADVRAWWRYGEADASPGGLADSAEELLRLLDDAVRLRLRSDVPVGAYLSGGLDSSLLVELARRRSPRTLKAFTVGVGGAADELAAARAAARRMGIEHHEVRVEPGDFALLPEIVWRLDEPIGDAIVVPLFRLSEAASRHVKVVLSGEGADELFGGYVHHLALSAMSYWRGKLPAAGFRAAAAAVRGMPLGWLSGLFPYPAALGAAERGLLASFVRGGAAASPSEEYAACAELFRADDKAALYSGDFGAACAGGRPGLPSSLDEAPDGAERTRLAGAMAFDFRNWLPDYTLLKQDRMAFAHSVEVRVPYLDHRVIEFAAALPDAMKVAGLTTKRVLREAARRLLPPALAGRRKKAFYLPVRNAFDGRFEGFLRELLLSRRALERGYFRGAAIEGLLADFRSPGFLASKRLVALAVLELWFRAYADGTAPVPAGSAA